MTRPHPCVPLSGSKVAFECLRRSCSSVQFGGFFPPARNSRPFRAVQKHKGKRVEDAKDFPL